MGLTHIFSRGITYAPYKFRFTLEQECFQARERHAHFSIALLQNLPIYGMVFFVGTARMMLSEVQAHHL